MAKQYRSFSEIDERLHILKLQREINVESIKLSFNRTRNHMYPTELLGGAKGIIQKILLTLAIKKLSNFSGRLRAFKKRE